MSMVDCTIVKSC